MVIVSTEADLKKALERKESQIKVTGKLAKKIKKLAPVFNLSPAKKFAIGVALGASFIPNPITKLSSKAAIEITGGEIIKIILASGVSVALILAIMKGYSVKVDVKENTVTLNKEK